MTNGSDNAMGHIDIAALSAGVVAVSVSLFVAPGEYSVINLIVSIVLIFVILGYVWGSARPRLLQSFAVASVLGLSSVPAIGFFDEAARFRSPLKLQYLLAEPE